MATAVVSSFGSARKHRFDRIKSRDTTSSAAASLQVSGQASRTNTHKEIRGDKYGQAPRPRLPDRPNTAGGTSSRSWVDKNLVKDDLPLHPLTANQTGTTYYDFPLPGSSPIVGRSYTASPSHSFNTESYDTESMNSGNARQYGIGMALGSPSHPPLHPQNDGIVMDRGATESPDTLEQVIDIWRDQAPLAKAKPSKWKSLGGIFGKKSQKPTPAFYSLQQEEQVPVNATSQPDYTRFPSPPATSDRDRSRGRARTNSQRKAKQQRPEAKRSATVPLDFEFDRAMSSKPLSKPTPELRLDGGPMLNVDIPDVHLERYSVMFGSLLKSNAQSQTPSLLVRRQATLDKLKTVNEAADELDRLEEEANSKLLRPRRVTSPQPMKSPAFSLFPSTQNNHDGSPAKRGPSSLQRSNTSPAALSPLRQTFELPRSSSSKPDAHAVGTPVSPTLKPKATLSEPWSADSSHLNLAVDSPTSTIEEIHDPVPLKPRLVEPEWEMVAKKAAAPLPTPPNSNSSASSSEMSRKMHSQQSSSSTTASTTSALTSASSIPSPININKSLPIPNEAAVMASSRTGRTRAQTVNATTLTTPTPTGVTVKSPVDSSLREAAVESAASISIARQISVSQRQRQLLIPITKPRSATLSNAHTPTPESAISPPPSSTTSPKSHFPLSTPMTGLNSSKSPSAHRQNPSYTAADYEEPHPGQKVIIPSRPSTSNSSSIPQPLSSSPPQGLQPQPPHHQLAAQTSLSSLSSTTSTAPPSSSTPQRKIGSVRAARLALAGIGGTSMASSSSPSPSTSSITATTTTTTTTIGINKNKDAILGINGYGIGTSIVANSGMHNNQGGERVRVRERKMSTPTLVQVGGVSTVPGSVNTVIASGKSGLGVGVVRGHQHRKSEMGVLEHA